MKSNKLSILASLLIAFFPSIALGAGADLDLPKAPINIKDRISAQRGAQIFMNHCVGCHSLKYLRYERMGQDLKIPTKVLQDNLAFTSDKIGDPILSSLSHEDGKAWFGVPPPDLSLEARLRGPDWLYGYLIGFYNDKTRPYGVNNHVFKDVGMPHVLATMEKELGRSKFEAAMLDLTNFLVYAAEPSRLDRERIGTYVLIFLALLFIPVYLLNKEYWKDVH
jgi:ubiquinol-cytochrome c reductase cytochrome c1 subunit